MTDYVKDTGSSGEMLIRDNGTTVSFLINSHNSSTFTSSLPWGYTVNGTNNNTRESNYSAGAGWVTLGSWTVTTDQTVTFRLFDTNTSGFGGPTTLSVSIDRSSAPSPPSKVSFSNITASSVTVSFTNGASNGSAIDLRQVGRNTLNSRGAGFVTTNNPTTVTGLEQGTLYYFWARTRNAKGFSVWGPVNSFRTIKVGDAPDQVIVSNATQTSFVASFTDNGNGGSAITSRQIAYNTTSTTTGATTVTYTSVMTVTGLQPATTYYVWGRVQNAAGWSSWSPVATIRTIAGAWFNVTNEWVEAVPYVKDGGIWKLAQPWGRTAGVWKETE